MVGFAEAPPGSEAPGVIVGHIMSLCFFWEAPSSKETMEEYIAEIRQKTFSSTSIDKKAASAKTKVTEAGLQRKGPQPTWPENLGPDGPGSLKL